LLFALHLALPLCDAATTTPAANRPLRVVTTPIAPFVLPNMVPLAGFTIVALVCFTDGVFEAESAAGHEFSQERLLFVSAANCGQSVEDLLQCVRRELAIFLDGPWWSFHTYEAPSVLYIQEAAFRP
jgi:hypothetical protein